MIKFIASDLDGTLLQNGAQSLNEEVFGLIRRLGRKGILFAAASGRQYMNMRHLFAPVKDEMMFLAENGALVMYKDLPVNQTVLPRELAVELMRDIYARPDCDVMLNGRYTCYLKPKREEYIDFMMNTMRYTLTAVEDLAAVQEDFFKVSAYVYSRRSVEVAAELEKKWGNYFAVAVSGPQWIDFNLGNKGAAIRFVQNELSLGRDEMMAFGDNFNDEYMLGAVGHGFAMENARDEIKRMAPYTCRRVEDVLRQVADGEYD